MDYWLIQWREVGEALRGWLNHWLDIALMWLSEAQHRVAMGYGTWVDETPDHVWLVLLIGGQLAVIPILLHVMRRLVYLLEERR